MTDLVFGVTFRADGSGLVGQARVAKEAVRDLGAAAAQTGSGLTALGGSSERMQSSLRGSGSAAFATAAAFGNAGQQAGTLGAQIAALAQRNDTLTAELGDAQRATAAFATRIDVLETRLKGVRGQSDSVTGALNRQSYAVRNIGQQFGDFGLQVAGGQDIARSFGQQAGQLGFALSELEKGPLKSVGRFLVGPWGIAFTVASAFVAPLIEKLFSAGKAAEEEADKLKRAADAADSFGTAQSLLGKVMDLSTGRLKTHNQVLIEYIRLQALAGQQQAVKDQREARQEMTDTLGDLGSPGRAAGMALAGLQGGSLSPTWDAPALRQLFGQVSAGTIGATEARKRLQELEASGKTAGQTFDDLFPKLLKVLKAGNDLAASQDVLDALDGKGVATDLKPYAREKKPKAARADTRTSGEAEEVRRINEQFDRTPALIDQASAATRKLDAIIADLAKRKPPGFQQLIADAERAKTVVRDGIARPYLDFLAEQRDALSVQRLIVDGRQDEADALQIVLGLERESGALLPGQKDAVLAIVQARRAEQHELDVLHQQTRKYLAALGDVRDAVGDVFSDPLRGLSDLPGRLLDSFKALSARFLFDKLVEPTFRKLEDQVNGTTPVKDAGERAARAFDSAAAAVGRLARAADGVTGAAPAATVAAAAADGAAPAAGAAAGAVADPIGSAAEAATIVVTGRRGPEAFFAHAIAQLAKGVKLAPEAADEIGRVSGKVLAGAATGTVAASVASSLFGVGGSGAAAQIGGGIGGALGKIGGEALGTALGSTLGGLAGPIGSVVGGVLGSVAGGLFAKTKSGSATIANVDGAGAITGTSGNSASYRAGASGMASGLLGGLDTIISRLGGELGDFSVSIGQRKKNFVVDPSGRGRTKGAGTQSFATEQEAAAAALLDAIADGAVKGISAAMQQALRSSGDVDKAVAEALKVEQVEALIGGVGVKLSKTFTTFDQTASQSLALARKYGLDTVAVEKKTAEQRVKLVQDTLAQSVGSLQDLLGSLASGDLFEGSGSDKRAALLTRIDTAKTSAAAGDDGAATRSPRSTSSCSATTATRSHGGRGICRRHRSRPARRERGDRGAGDPPRPGRRRADRPARRRAEE